MSTNLNGSPLVYAQSRATRTKKPVAVWQLKPGGARINDAEHLFCKDGEKHGARFLASYTKIGVVQPQAGRPMIFPKKAPHSVVLRVDTGPDGLDLDGLLTAIERTSGVKKAEDIAVIKGFRTPLYKWKKRHVEAQYGITVVEV